MRIFISWSGSLSQKVAIILRDWLPLVLSFVRPYVSAEDIDKGARWGSEIAKELEQSGFGILCITTENAAEPWINFEAGALAKTVDKSRVCPLLLDLRPAQIDRRSPLLQFQAATFEEADVWKLVESINRAGVSSQEVAIVKKQFVMWWPHLEREIKAAATATQTGRPLRGAEKSQVERMLEELLELTRDVRRRLSSQALDTGSPSILIPSEPVPKPVRPSTLAAFFKLSSAMSRVESEVQPDPGLVQEFESAVLAVTDREDELPAQYRLIVSSAITLLNKVKNRLKLTSSSPTDAP
jgi:hypothetical protein